MSNTLTIARQLLATYTAACAALATDERAECDQLAQVHTALCNGATSEDYAHTGGNIYVSYTIHAAGDRLLLVAATFEVFSVVLLPRAYTPTDVEAAHSFLYDFAGDEERLIVLQACPFSSNAEERDGKVGPAATDEYTFAEFQATRTDVADLSDESGMIDDEGNPIRWGGYRYASGLWIIRKPDGTFYLLLIQDEYESANLAELERKLYDYGVECGEINAVDDVEIFYASTGEECGSMSLEELIRNFHAHGGWGLKYNAPDMRDDIKGKGWYEGTHDCGNYLVLNLDKLGLCVTLDMDADKLDAAIARARGAK